MMKTNPNLTEKSLRDDKLVNPFEALNDIAIEDEPSLGFKGNPFKLREEEFDMVENPFSDTNNTLFGIAEISENNSDDMDRDNSFDLSDYI